MNEKPVNWQGIYTVNRICGHGPFLAAWRASYAVCTKRSPPARPQGRSSLRELVRY